MVSLSLISLSFVYLYHSLVRQAGSQYKFVLSLSISHLKVGSIPFDLKVILKESVRQWRRQSFQSGEGDWGTAFQGRGKGRYAHYFRVVAKVPWERGALLIGRREQDAQNGCGVGGPGGDASGASTKLLAQE